MVRRKSSSNGSSTKDFRPMDHGTSRDFCITCDFLGSSLHRSPANLGSRSSLVVVVEKIP
jgi:hypothetical protein